MTRLTHKKAIVMDHTGTFLKSARDAAENGCQIQMTRRTFVLAASMGAAEIALNAYAGSGFSNNGGSPPAAKTPQPPGVETTSHASTEWRTIPTLTFTDGVAATISIADYVSDNESLAIIKNSASLPFGVTYDAATKSFVYDGMGPVCFTDGHVLTVIEV
jgi:hypothetical protein